MGTTYGGDGRTSFAVPDMRGRSAIHYGTGPGLTPFRVGQKGGRKTAVLNATNIPAHTHLQTPHSYSLARHSHTANLATHTGVGDANTLVGGSFATYPSSQNVYATGTPDGENAAGETIVVDATTASSSGDNTPVPTSLTGTSLAFQIRDPYLTLRSCLVTQGIYPSRN